MATDNLVSIQKENGMLTLWAMKQSPNLLKKIEEREREREKLSPLLHHLSLQHTNFLSEKTNFEKYSLNIRTYIYTDTSVCHLVIHSPILIILFWSNSLHKPESLKGVKYSSNHQHLVMFESSKVLQARAVGYVTIYSRPAISSLNLAMLLRTCVLFSHPIQMLWLVS